MYSYERRLEKVDPEDVRVELEFGIWWQAVLGADALARGRDLGSLRWVPRAIKTVDNGPSFAGDMADPREVIATANDFWREQTPRTMEVWAERIGEALPDRLEGLYERWLEQWAEERRTELPLAVELGWGRDLPSLRDGQNPNTRLVGYVDEVYLDTKRNMIVVRDNKSHRTLSTQTSADDMMDSQLQFYAWGASPEITSWGLGKVQATAYDRVRSVKPSPPQLTMGGRLAMRGGEPSIGQCDLHTYLQWAAGPTTNKDGDEVHDGQWYPGTRGHDPGWYQAEPEVISKLSTPAARSVWFQRTLTPLNGNIVRTHLRAAVDSSVDLQRSRERAVDTREASRNLTANCRWCDFAKLCRAEMVGGADGDYDLVDLGLRVRN
jgi:hypothetical protein